MNPVAEPLLIDLVQWCGQCPRTYGEVIEAWRTSCPRLMIWEEAKARGLLETVVADRDLMVVVTPKGRRLLDICKAATVLPTSAAPPRPASPKPA